MANKNIFGAVAGDYYAAGIPVIPLHFHDKRPIPKEWQRFHEALPDPDVQLNWIQHYTDANVGVVLGEQSGMVVMDIDTTDEALIKLITDILPPSPWQRIGKKGVVLAYKFGGLKTFRIKDVNNNTLVEMLSSRTQVVLPPSIHPETQLPYQENVPLLSVLGELPELNPEIESILRGALVDAGVELSHSGWTRVTDWTPAGARDVQMTKVAGHYAYGVMRGELSLLEAIDRMKAWYATSVEQVAGDDVNIEKGIQNLIKFVARDVLEKEKILPLGWDDGLSDEDKEKMGLAFSDEHQEWDYEQLKAHLHLAFEQYDPDTPGRLTAIDFVLKQLSRSKNLGKLDEDRLFRYIIDAGGCHITLGALRARLRELSVGEMQGKDHTEIAKAVIQDIEQSEMIRYYQDKFWTWNGSNWAEKPNVEILKQIASEYGNKDAAKRNSDHNGILRVMSTLVPQHLRTTEVKGVNFANGFLTEDLKLIAHNPEFGMTYTLPFRYMPDMTGKAFRFFDFLQRCWGRDPDYEDKLKALQEALCVTIFGVGPSFQRVILLYGPPKSGKSQMLKIAGSLVPDGARSNCPPDSWGDRFLPATMANKLINVCGELSSNRRIDGQKFKDIVDGQEMAGQFKGRQIFNFSPKVTHWFASNHLPKTDDTSVAFNRRWLILHFGTPVTAREQVRDLGDIIVAEEREAIAAWAVEAYPRLRVEPRDFTLPASHEEIMEDVANGNNSVRFFILESGRVKVVKEEESGEQTLPHTSELPLHNAYWSFCLGAGAAKPVGPRAFRQQMRDLAYETGFKMNMRTTANGSRECLYTGLTLVDARAA